MTGRLAHLWIHPLKSAAGVAVDDVEVERWGLVGDRRWAIVDAAGSHSWLGEHPGSLAIRAEALPGGGLLLEHDGAGSIAIGPEDCGASMEVDFPGLTHALRGPAAANAWLTAALGRDLQLIHLPAGATRAIAPEHGGLPGEVTSLAWDAPLHLISRTSLDQLDTWIAETAEVDGREAGTVRPMAPERFRSNVIVDGHEPFAEDRWSRVRIGEIEFRVSELCDRCAVTLYDPATLAKAKEPIRTLARKRSWDGKTWFGIRLVPLGAGRLRVGDPVVPLA